MENVTDYFRYWAGYTVLTRPMLALWGLEGLRMVSGALLAVSGAAALITVARASSRAYVAGLALPLLVASNVMSTPSSSFGFALSYAAALLAVLLTALGARHGIERAVLGAIVGAAIFNYATQLTTPAIPWMIVCIRNHVGVAVGSRRAVRRLGRRSRWHPRENRPSTERRR
ncbi:MAG: hypothetical protein H0V69_08400 [Acidimicrobiia bacterium]|nr:hypothetical protein [Acidimicrobiia bacterium]